MRPRGSYFRMTGETKSPGPNTNEALVRDYFDALRRGAIVDALNAFATDATFLGEDGRSRRGIREIAAFFANRRDPLTIQVDAVERVQGSIIARVRVQDGRSGRTEEYRDVFRLSGQRIRSLTVEPRPGRAVPKAS